VDLLLLVNPTARSGTARRIAAHAARMLRERGVVTRVVAGGDADGSRALLREALSSGADAIAVCGGDGTVRLAIEQMAGSGIPLGIIPAGTGNDVAACLGIPHRDAAAAVSAIVDGTTRHVDLGVVTSTPAGTDRVSRTLYASVLACGFDARVNDRANRMRWPKGSARYTRAILREFLTLRATRFTLDLELPDGTWERREEELLMATVANGPTYGGGIPICPVADVGDGLLDVVLIRPMTRVRLLRLLPRLYAGRHLDAPEVRMTRVRSVRVSAEGQRAYADGDIAGELPVTVTAMPRAVEVFVTT
jgi:diacylglycerol kinase (ATP)